MNNHYLNFINELEKDFYQFQEIYLKLSTSIRLSNAEQFALLKEQWQILNQTESPSYRINDVFIDYDESGELPNQIKDILLNNNLGVIEYTKVLLKKQFNFIIREFEETAIFYENNTSESIDLLDAMYNNAEGLADDEFIKAVELQFIEAFLIFEEYFTLAYPLHGRSVFNLADQAPNASQSRIIAEDDIEDKRIEPIKLACPEELKSTIIKIIHDTFNVEFIDSISLDEFTEYFKANTKCKKLRWKGKDLELALLFEGVGLANKTFKIKIQNNPKKLLCNTFLKKDGRSFFYKNLADNVRNAKERKATRVNDKLISLLLSINDLI